MILEIDTLAAGGDGVGRDADGRVTFVRRTAPGDRVEVELLEEKRGFARGRVTSIAAPSADRVDAPCPLFVNDTCGGCQWQHVAIEVQRRAKEELVRAALRRLDVELLPIEAPVADYGWRRRARLHWFRPRGAAAAIVGFMAPRSSRVTRVDACPQIEPALEAVLPALHRVLAPGLHKRGDIELVLGEGGAVHVAVHGPSSAAAAQALLGQAGITGVRAGKRHFGARSVALEGGDEGRADWFAQASSAGNAALRALVLEAAAPLDGARVLELYAGSGNFTRGLAGRAREVVAVDTQPPAGDIERVRWRRGDAGRVTATLAERGEAFDLVVLDPPRSGAREAMAGVAAIAAPRVVYVSCDPATLGRDLEALAEAGYRVSWARPIDLMPQTAHVEVVALAERR